MSAVSRSYPGDTEVINNVAATFGNRQFREDPEWEAGFAQFLRDSQTQAELLDTYSRFSSGEGFLDALMRRVVLRSLCKRVGNDLQVGPALVLKHPETIEFGDCVFVGAMTMIQGRINGQCKIGNHVWIGPHSYFDARDLIVDDYVGWGPGAKVLGS